MSSIWYTEFKGEVSQVKAVVNRSILISLILTLDPLILSFVCRLHTYPQNKHKCVKREQGKRRLQIPSKRTWKRKREREWSTYIIWAPRSLARPGQARPSQARPEARLWLRDHLGRQAWSAEEVKGAGGRTDRRENHRRAKKNREEDSRGTSRDEGRRSSIVVSSFELWNRIGRHCGRRKRGNQRRGPSRLHSSGTRVFKHGYPRECRSTTDRITHTHVRPYKLQDLLFLSLSYSCFSSFRLCNLFGTIPSHNVLLPLMPPSHAYTDTNPQNPLAPLHHRVVRFSSPLAATRTARPTELATPCLARPADGQRRGSLAAALPRPRTSSCTYLRPQGQIR